MKRATVISVFLVTVAISVAGYYVHSRIAEKKRLWAEQVMSASRDGTIKKTLEVLGNPTSEWKTIPADLSRYSNGSVTNYSRVLLFLHVNQGAFVYVDDNERIIGAEVFEQ